MTELRKRMIDVSSSEASLSGLRKRTLELCVNWANTITSPLTNHRGKLLIWQSLASCPHQI